MQETFCATGVPSKASSSQSEMSSYETLVSGDFNNMAFSYIYQKLKLEMNDAFEERGMDWGHVFLQSLSLRIDFIWPSETIDCIEFTTGDYSFSDHYPIIATLGWH